MNRWLRTGFALFLSGNACALDLVCPAQLAVSSEARDVPAGWEAFEQNEPHRFDHVTVYYRHPREMGSQVPDNEGSKQPPLWAFEGLKSEEYWVACEYFGTDVQVIKALPAGLKRCSATSKGVRCQ